MAACQENSPAYAALFAYYKKLAAVLADKADLGVRMKAAYDKNQLLALKEICEKQNEKNGILAEPDVTDTDAVNHLLNQEIKCTIARGLSVLYCIGEKKRGTGLTGRRFWVNSWKSA